MSAVASRRAVLLAGTASLAGCATWTPEGTVRLMAAPPAGLPPRVELAGMPFFPQTPLHCGPAALATVLRQAGIAADPATLGEQIFLPARGGTLQVEMLAGARRHGAYALALAPRLEDLLRELAAGQPVVVLQNLGFEGWPQWHYAVAIGYALEPGDLILRSGTTERLVLPLRTFEHTWARAGRWAMLALPPGTLAATVAEREALAAALAFERVALPARAAQVYGALATRWPDNLVARLGQGNTLAAAGDKRGAAAAFEAAAQRHDSAAAWNNLAHLRWQLNEPAAAREALARAERGQGAELPAVAAALRSTRKLILDRQQAPSEPAQNFSSGRR